MENKTYPRWLGPFVGMWTGALYSISTAIDQKSMVALFVGVVCGGVAGIVVALPRSFRTALLSAPASNENPGTTSNHVVGVVGGTLGMIPMMGLPFAVITFAFNRKCNDWSYVVGKLVFVWSIFCVVFAMSYNLILNSIE